MFKNLALISSISEYILKDTEFLKIVNLHVIRHIWLTVNVTNRENCSPAKAARDPEAYPHPPLSPVTCRMLDGETPLEWDAGRTTTSDKHLPCLSAGPEGTASGLLFVLSTASGWSVTMATFGAQLKMSRNSFTTNYINLMSVANGKCCLETFPIYCITVTSPKGITTCWPSYEQCFWTTAADLRRLK